MSQEQEKYVAAWFLTGANTQMRYMLGKIKREIEELSRNSEDIPKSLLIDEKNAKWKKVFCRDIEAIKPKLSPDIQKLVESVQKYFEDYFAFLQAVEHIDDIDTIIEMSDDSSFSIAQADSFMFHKIMEKAQTLDQIKKVLDMDLFLGLQPNHYTVRHICERIKSIDELLQVTDTLIVRGPLNYDTVNGLIQVVKDTQELSELMRLLEGESMNALSYYFMARIVNNDQSLSQWEREEMILSLLVKVTPQIFEECDIMKTKNHFLAIIRDNIQSSASSWDFSQKLQKTPFGKELYTEYVRRG